MTRLGENHLIYLPKNYFFASIRLLGYGLALLACSFIFIFFIDVGLAREYVPELVAHLLLWMLFVSVSGFSFGASIFGVVSLFKERRLFVGVLVVLIAIFVGLIPLAVGPAIIWL